jgi:hypothetical protein
VNRIDWAGSGGLRDLAGRLRLHDHGHQHCDHDGSNAGGRRIRTDGSDSTVYAGTHADPATAGDPLGLTGDWALKAVWTARHQLDTDKSGGNA